MTTNDPFEAALTDAFARLADRAPVAADAVALTAVVASPRGSAHGGFRRRPWVVIIAAAMVLISLVVGAALIGRQRPVIDGTFVAGPAIPDGRIVNAVALPDGRVLVGIESETTKVPGTMTLRCSVPCRPHLAILDPRTGAFTLTRDQPSSLSVGSMALLRDGRVLIIRGSTEGADAQPAMTYDPAADRFDEVGAPLAARVAPYLVTLADGRVLVGGGETDNAPATIELFDPTTGTFTSAGPMARPRTIGASATLLRDGRVLVTGGGAEVGVSAELYDPGTDTFAPTGPMTVARGGFQSATLLTDGRVLIAGGLVPDAEDPRTIPESTATAEVFDPVTGTFSPVGSMAAPRFMHAASILPDGSVLVAAGAHDLGADGIPALTADAEIFDPSSGTFRATGTMHRPRLGPTAVPVGDRVLVLGHVYPPEDDQVIGISSEWFD